MQQVTTIRSNVIRLPVSDVDTDQIIPARFLTTTEQRGLGEHLFAEWRAESAGNPFNAPDAGERSILVAGPNFGCGSSREHAVWALMDFGFRAVVSSSLADIFTSNAIRNGLLPVIIEQRAIDAILLGADEPVEINLEAQSLTHSDVGAVPFRIDPFARRCLLEGTDELGFILAHEEQINAAERAAAWTH